MTRSNWIGLLGSGLSRGRRRVMLCGAGILAGVAALIFFLELGAGVRDAVLDQWINDLPAEEVQVTAPVMALGPLQMDRPKFLGGGKTLDDKLVANLKSLTLPINGADTKVVRNVWRQLDADFPVSITGALFGISYGTDTAVSGVDPELIAQDARVGSFTYGPEQQEVPALVPKALLDVYNSSFARAQDLPQLNPSFLLGKHFDMHLGVSSISPATGNGEIEAKGIIAGLTDRGALLGVTVPIKYVEDWNKRIGKSGGASGYTMLTVVARDPRYVPAITEAIRNMGFEAKSSTGLAERVGGIIAAITAGLSLVAGVILFVAGLNAWSLFRLMALETRKETGLLMALGATRGEVLSLSLAQAAAIGLGGGLAGVFVSLVAGWGTNIIVRNFTDIPFLPQSLMHFQFGIAALGVGLAVVISVIAALPAARQLSRLDPAEILS